MKDRVTVDLNEYELKQKDKVVNNTTLYLDEAVDHCMEIMDLIDNYDFNLTEVQAKLIESGLATVIKVLRQSAIDPNAEEDVYDGFSG